MLVRTAYFSVVSPGNVESTDRTLAHQRDVDTLGPGFWIEIDVHQYREARRILDRNAVRREEWKCGLFWRQANRATYGLIRQIA